MLDIIIPAYNSHETIIKTLCSICLQTMKDNINVYIVNDASNDDYQKIIKKFSDKISITELTLLKNSGPGVARQYGIDNSNSEFIMFIDSDDLFYNCFSVEKIFNKIINSDYDMAVGVIADESIDEINYYDNHQGNLHGKIYRRSFLNKYNIRFNNTTSNEDNSFNQLYLMAKPQIVHCNDIVYLYRYNPNSITQKDPNYCIQNLEWYVYNMCWAIEQAEKRKFDKYEIAKVALSSIYYVYFCYLKYNSNEQSKLIILWSKKLLKYYYKYKNYLDETEKYRLYCNYQNIYDYILPLSVNGFISIVESLM